MRQLFEMTTKWGEPYIRFRIIYLVVRKIFQKTNISEPLYQILKGTLMQI